MQIDEVTIVRTVAASTPFMVAVASTGREVTLKVDRDDRIRFMAPGKPPFGFGYAIASGEA